MSLVWAVVYVDSRVHVSMMMQEYVMCIFKKKAKTPTQPCYDFFCA